MKTRIALSFVLLASLAFGHTAESAGAPPAEVSPAVGAVLQKEGIRIKDGKRTVMELWFRSAAPKGPKTSEDAVSMTEVPHGSLLAVARFTERGKDRRGQTIKPGVYTMRLSFFPPNGDHQGAAPQRDFLLLSSATDDKDPNTTPEFTALVEQSRKVSGTPHPAVFSAWKVDPSAFKAGVAQEGEADWVLQTKVGDLPIALIVDGVFNH